MGVSTFDAGNFMSTPVGVSDIWQWSTISAPKIYTTNTIQPTNTQPSLITQIEEIAKLVDGLGFVAGSAARYVQYTTDVKPGDIDIFSYTPDCVEAIHGIIAEQGFGMVAKTTNATTYVKKGHLPVQVIHSLINPYTVTCGSVSEVLKHFSFGVEKYALRYVEGKRLVHSEDTHHDASWKRLTLGHVDHPVDIMQRIAKYVKQGYTIKNEEVMKIFQIWDSRPEEWRKEALTKVKKGEVGYDLHTNDKVAQPYAPYHDSQYELISVPEDTNYKLTQEAISAAYNKLKLKPLTINTGTIE